MKWDEQGRILEVNNRNTVEEANVLISSVIDTYPNAFYVESDIIHRKPLGWIVTSPGNVEYQAPPPIVPDRVTALQARKALRAIGLHNTVNQFINQQSEDIQEAWEYATEISYNDPILNAMIAELGWTQAQKDALFISAASYG